MQCWHITLAAAGRERLFPDGARTVRAVRAIASLGRAVVLFCVVDDHVHLVVAGTRAEAGAIARRLSRALGAILGAPLAPAHIQPVNGRSHLDELVGYALRQPVRHDLGVHPAAWPGGCFWDLVGARIAPGFDGGTLRSALPRVKDERFWREVGLDPGAVPTLEVATAALGPQALLNAASDALCTAARDRTADSVDARAAVVALRRRGGAGRLAIARELALPERTVSWLAGREVAPERIAVIERQLRLRAALLGAPTPRPTESELRSMRRARALAG